MQTLNLNDLLRYGFAGGAFLILTMAGFCSPRDVLRNGEATAFLAATILGVGLTVGSILYALHRAVPFPLLYKAFAKLAGRGESTLELDIQRWRHLAAEGSLQSHMSDWGAQVHFLYCISWAGFSSLLLGSLASWNKSELWCAVLSLAIIFLISALVHHYRYQVWERRVFEVDAASADDAAGASSAGTQVEMNR